MYTYAEASKQYAAGRKYVPIGTEVTNNVWLTYDQPNDCYVLSYVQSRYYEVVVDGQKRWAKASTAERDKYTMHEIARVYPTHTHACLLTSATRRGISFRTSSTAPSARSRVSRSRGMTGRSSPQRPRTTTVTMGTAR